MKKLVKWALRAGGFLLLAFALLVLAGKVFFDPNDFKHHAIEFVHENTGQQLEINGAVGLQWFPSLHLQVSGVRLITQLDSVGYPLFSAAGLDLKLDLWSLLRNRLEIDELALRQPVLNLSTDQDGQGNWESLLSSLSAKKSPASDTRDQDSGVSLAVHRVEMRDASVHWMDNASGNRFDLEHLNISTGYLSPGRPALVEARFGLSMVKPTMNLKLSLKGEMSTEEDFTELDIDGLVIDMTAYGESIQESGAALKLTADLALNFTEESFQVDDLSIIGADARISGQLHGRGSGGVPELNGRMLIHQINLRSWLGMLGLAVDTADAGALTRVSAEIGLQQENELLLLHPVQIQVDDSRIQGRAQTRAGDNLQINGRLAIDHIDLDRYLPKPGAGEETGSQLSVRVEALRNLQLDAELTFDQLTLNGIDLNRVIMKVQSREGMLLLEN